MQCEDKNLTILSKVSRFHSTLKQTFFMMERGKIMQINGKKNV